MNLDPSSISVKWLRTTSPDCVVNDQVRVCIIYKDRKFLSPILNGITRRAQELEAALWFENQVKPQACWPVREQITQV